MHPNVLGISPYIVAWLVAAAVAIPFGVLSARRHGFPAARAGIAIATCAALLLVGSKALYLLEGWAFPNDDYVPPPLRSWAHGFRIPGGVALLALAGPFVCKSCGLPWRTFGDASICAVPLAIVCIRIGCFLTGCCFGDISNLPWAVTFPPGSWAHRFHHAHGFIGADAPASLAVHPLQLYFAGAAVLAFLWSLGARPGPSGRRQIEFYILFFSTSALIEPFRAVSLTLNTILLLVASLITGAYLLRLTLLEGAATGRVELARRT